MDDRALLSLLQSLAQLDIDACHSYRRVVERVQDENVRRQLLEFWRDHERHVDELAAAIHRRGGTPPDFERDAAGIVIEGFTRLRAATGIGGALRALKTNERLTNAAYAAATKERTPDEVRDLLERNRTDEQRHLDYVRDVLARPEHRGAGLGTVLAGAALVAAGARARNRSPPANPSGWSGRRRPAPGRRRRPQRSGRGISATRRSSSDKGARRTSRFTAPEAARRGARGRPRKRREGHASFRRRCRLRPPPRRAIRPPMRLAVGTALLVLGLAIYAFLVMYVAVTALPDSLVVQTLYYLVAGLLWVWPAARMTRWMQRG